MDNEKILELAKKTYEEGNYEESLKYANILLDKNLSNDYLYQITAAMLFLKQDYKKALLITDNGLKLYNDKNYVLNKIKILHKLSDDTYYAEKMCKFIREMIELSSLCLDDEQIDMYVSMKNQDILVSGIAKLFEDDKIDKNVYAKICLAMIYKYTLSAETNVPLVKLLLDKEIGLHIDNDNILIENLSKLSGALPNILAIYYLTTPDILNDNKNVIDKFYKRAIANLKKLIQHFQKPLFNSADELYNNFKAYYYYYFVYYGYNNVELYRLISTLLKNLCPDIRYIKSFTPPDKTQKIKIGFISDFLRLSHSVCKDRIGIIKSLSLDNRFDTYIISKEEKEQEIYKYITKDCKINKIILEENIKDSRSLIDSQNFDIIVYPEIGMSSFFYLLAHSRLAPIQINTWGHSETSGIDTIDYYFSSKYYETEKMSENYSEKLVLLDSLCTHYYSLDMFDFAKNIKNNKKQILLDFNLPSNCNLYGSLQEVCKYQPKYINLLKNILCNDPKAIIIFLCGELKQKFYSYLEKHLGYHMNRVRIFNRLNQEEYCKMVSISDILLDPFPFGGCNTSLDAFYFNKIVVTCPSDKLNGRFTYGFYKKMGIDEPICEKMEDLSTKAIYYMNNREERLKIEQAIEKNKHVLYEEQDSISTWKSKLIELYEKIKPKKTFVVT
jgi:predicted O-linked N-acetylglucosamine transferase (SPINDLY family)